MSTPAIWALCAGTVLASWALTRAFRIYALTRGMVDVPNERSSHRRPTPRGGGVAIVVTTIAALSLLALGDVVSWRFVLGFSGAGCAVAVAGFLDDRNDIRKRWRFLTHFLAAFALVTTLGGIRGIGPFNDAVSVWVGWPLVLMYIVWTINLTNFMDGIDGLAASEAVTVAGGGILIYMLAVPGSDAWAAPLVFAAAVSGFLLWNRPPARIFMGDVGSGFVGLALAALPLHASTFSPSLFWGWIILLGVFIVDASLTLLRRLLRGERVYDAHRMHGYQHAAVRWRTHGGVTLAVLAINLFWLLPLACAVALRHLEVVTGVALAYAPVTAAAVWLGAGVPEIRRQREEIRPARN
jgi:Fuc2NAc and GlcNAc transferase